MNTEQIEQMIKEYFTKAGGTYGGFTVPFHRHTGSDSPQISATDILISPNIGIPFKNNQEQYNLYVFQGNGSSPLILDPLSSMYTAGTAEFYIGKGGIYNGTVLNKVFIFTGAPLESQSPQVYMEANAEDTGSNSALQINPASIAATTDVFNFLSSNAGTFAIKLPDAPRPTASPGMIAFDSGSFYVCKTAGVWTLLI